MVLQVFFTNISQANFDGIKWLCNTNTYPCRCSCSRAVLSYEDSHSSNYLVSYGSHKVAIVIKMSATSKLVRHTWLIFHCDQV